MEQQNQLNYHQGPGARPAVFADLLLVLTTPNFTKGENRP